MSGEGPASATAAGRRRYGTFEGVFVPTLLTILGVIMYLRAGWVVGNAGVGGGLAIIALAFGITAATGLSMSSVTTNIQIGPGGAYSIISRSLGLEVGGSIGIPLYLSQALVVSMYVFGFREGWQSIFPDHPALLVDLVVFVLLLTIASVSAKFAFRVQYVILALIVASLVSVAASLQTTSLDQPIRWWGEFPGAPEDGFPGTSFWPVFAVFFPAATGIMAGANLSGELENPRRSIPVGTMAAIGVSFVVYALLAVWLARVAPPDELVANYTVMIDRAAWAPAVLAGLLGATFSSALASVVGAPRILQALASHGLVPSAGRLARTTARGEPRNAMAVTAVIAGAALLLRDLNAVAPLITMFFLVTYTVINAVVLVEQSLGLVSFRPTLRLPRWVALAGTAGCLLAMFIINPLFGLVAVVIVLGVYAYLIHRQITAPYGDVRSGLFVAVAEWAAKKVDELRGTHERAWKPDLLVPVQDDRELRATFRLIHALAFPKGSVSLMGIADAATERLSPERFERLCEGFRDEDVFASWTVLRDVGFADAVRIGLGAMGGSVLRPNIVFLTVPTDGAAIDGVQRVVADAPRLDAGIVLYAPHPTTGLGRQRVVNLWLRSYSIHDRHGEMDLAVLIGYKLRQNWSGRLRLLTCVAGLEDKARAQADLVRLAELTRVPEAEVYVLVGDFEEAVARAPQADLDILGLPDEFDPDWFKHLVLASRSSCLFIRGSGREDALA